MSHLPHYISNDVKLALEKDFTSADVFHKMLTWLRSTPLMTTARVNTLNISRESAKTKLQDKLKAEYGNRFIVEEHPTLLDLLVIPSPVVSNNSQSRYPEAIVDVRCGGAVLRGSNVYCPGVLALPSSVKSGDKVSIYVDMLGKCLRGLLKPFDGFKIFIANGICVVSRKDIFTIGEAKGVAIKVVEPICPSIETFQDDTIFLQNLPSVVCGHVLNPLPNEWILDMCAAPGGKTTHLATLIKNEGIVIALDKTKKKITAIQSNASRFGLTCVNAFEFNAIKAVDVKLNLKIARNAIGPGAPPYPPETFDRILLDAPCSALGQRPQLCVNISAAQLYSFSALQRKLFATAVELLKVGGTLVYSTCTFTLAENEQIVEWALATFPSLSLEQQIPHLGESGIEGTSLTREQLKLLQRFDYRCKDFYTSNSIGFFIAKFIKNGQ